MSFKLSTLTLASVSVLTLSALTGCSTISNWTKPSTSQNASSSQMFSSQGAPAVSRIKTPSHDPYDSFYGSPSDIKTQVYQPKTVRLYKGKTASKSSPALFKTTAPKRYVVKKGDTLWAISNKFLNNPAYWPEIWDKNQKIKNPHLIYPGDVLFIYEGGRRKVRVANKVTGKVTFVEKMVPQMRIERTGSTLGQPISTLSSFLVWPRVLDKSTMEKAPYIVDGRDSHILIEKDDTVFIKNLSDRHAGGRYAVFHQGKELRDPATGKVYGNEVTYGGFLEVERTSAGAEVATATVVESKREIRRGDRLLYVNDETHQLDAPIQIPKHKVRGSIISLFDSHIMSAQTQVVVINKGSRQGIKPGYTLGVYSLGKKVNDPYEKAKRNRRWEPVVAAKVGIPPQRVATAIVYKTTGDLSYALITKSSHPVKNGYKIGNP